MYKKSIFWFRQDLRTSDNTALLQAIEKSETILPIFILDTNLIDNFWGLDDPKFAFIREAIDQISLDIKNSWGLWVKVFHGKPEEILPELCSKYDIKAIFTNTSYGSYGKERDTKVAEISRIDFNSFKDYLIAEPYEIEQRKVFTPYYKLWQKYIIGNPEVLHVWWEIKNFSQLECDAWSDMSEFVTSLKHPYFTMEFGRERFNKLPFAWYKDFRNDLDKDGTSRLSPYLRFGVFSPRQLIAKVIVSPYQGGAAWKAEGFILPEKWTHEECFVSELCWREFWWQIIHNFPQTKDIEFQEKRRHISWSDDAALFQKWKDGETGYPVVDAAMRQLRETNWMHGRARMIVASFLTKDMHIDWRLWEKYFKEMLLDYDEAVNLWNWQWSASVGADPKPLRIFNPSLQSEKFDPNAEYIKKYLPEVELEKVEDIHNPLSWNLSYQDPIVDHSLETKVARELYRYPED